MDDGGGVDNGGVDSGGVAVVFSTRQRVIFFVLMLTLRVAMVVMRWC